MSDGVTPLETQESAREGRRLDVEFWRLAEWRRGNDVFFAKKDRDAWREMAEAHIAATNEARSELAAAKSRLAAAEERATRAEAALVWLWNDYSTHNARGSDGPCDCDDCRNVHAALALVPHTQKEKNGE